jgi:hypothetical protein
MVHRSTSAVLGFALGVFVLGLSGASFAQSGSSEKPHVAVERLTFSLLDLQDQHQKAAPAQKAQQLEKMLTTAATRQDHLATLIETDPAQVLRLRLPKHLRASLPPAVQGLVEDEVTLDGDLEVIHEDRTDGSRYHHFLNAGRERLSLHFVGEPPMLKTGQRVRIKGVRVQQAVALAGGSGSVQTLAAALPNTLGLKKTLVILVNFQDNASQPYTPATAQSVVFTSTSNWDLENSFQQTWLGGDVYGWFTIPMSSTVCDYYTLATYAKNAAAAAGANLATYTRYVYAFPRNACGWWGLGMVGGSPSQAWINGSFQLAVVGHEMGHNFGLYHSHALECGATTIGTTCSSIEYGDPIDIMGSSVGHLNAFQKERLGWLNAGASPPITTVLASGTYVVDPYETAGTNAKALKILQATNPTTGKKTWYYVEYRRATGFDSFLASNSNVLNGVVVHRGSETSADSSYLLDMTPATSSWSDPALTVGPTFTDAAAGVTISVAWVSSTGAAVNVAFGSTACVPANPTMTVTPSESQWVPAGTPVTYTLSLTNKDNAGCTAATFDLQANAPTGWSATFATTPLTAAPGATASATVTMTSPASLGDGFYTIGLSAINRAATTFSASSSVTYVVNNVAAPTMTRQPQSQTVTAPTMATFNVTASGTAPLSYQWQKNGANIAGATSASYTTPATTTADSGSSYRVMVSNSVSSVTSSAAMLTVNAGAVAPAITSQPANMTVTAPANATFSVSAGGTAPLSYQWQKSGANVKGANNYTNIAGATSASYTTPATTIADSGRSYRVVVSNPVSSVISTAATLTVRKLPKS